MFSMLKPNVVSRLDGRTRTLSSLHINNREKLKMPMVLGKELDDLDLFWGACKCPVCHLWATDVGNKWNIQIDGLCIKCEDKRNVDEKVSSS
jgi:hypothetical protein